MGYRWSCYRPKSGEGQGRRVEGEYEAGLRRGGSIPVLGTSAPDAFASGAFRFAHPRRNIFLSVQDPPHVDVIATLDVEDKMRVPLQRPRA